MRTMVPGMRTGILMSLGLAEEVPARVNGVAPEDVAVGEYRAVGEEGAKQEDAVVPDAESVPEEMRPTAAKPDPARALTQSKGTTVKSRWRH